MSLSKTTKSRECLLQMIFLIHVACNMSAKGRARKENIWNSNKAKFNQLNQ